MLRPFRSSGYRWLWFSNAAGSAGRWSLVLVLSSQIAFTTHSSFWVGLGLFLTQGPVILLAPISGVLADRLDRRLLNVASAALAAAVTAVFALASWTGRVDLLLTLVLSVLYGFSFVFQMTLRSTLLPSLLPHDELVGGISLFQVGTQGAQFLGPALATPLLALGGPAAAWLFCSALYAASAVLSLPIGSMRAAAGTAPAGRMRASLAYLLARPLAWTAIVAVSIHCALTMGYQGMLPMFVSVDLRSGDAAYGALLTSIGLGAVLGSLGLARFSDVRYRPAIFAVSLVGSGLFLALMGAAPNPALAMPAGFFAGATQAVFMSMALALIQGSVEDDFRGRATSLYQLITMAPMAIFGWGMGGLADITEPRPLMITAGLAFLVVMAGYGLLSPWLRGLLRPEGWRYRPAEVLPVAG